VSRYLDKFPKYKSVMTVHNASHLLDYGGWFDKDMETTMADVWQVRDTLEDW
jgi:hypothetical protein